MLIKDVVREIVFTINYRATLKDAAYLLAVNGVDSLTVVDNEQKVLGIITEQEIFKPKEQMEMDNDLLLGSLINLRNPQRFINELAESADLPVTSAMVSNPAILKESQNIKDAMQTIYKSRLSTIPVVDESDRLVGIIYQQDIIKLMER
ncbi:CBS domain-containing protein [Proteinivorax hydrogeniformans]|uniref:CBS domain-containing protein n=1 Tax=Proteinivorax hydrogeniformans TaxID=1826727 RepID=A0AAU8HTW1_9FIRM